MAEDLCLKLQNGTQLFVPNRLDAITTYVILEQERWFEKEWGFVEHLLTPGMVAIDIGANLGIYSVAIAKAVGPAGRVYAYEPTSETRARLERSKAVNGADNLVVLGSALSDTEREGRIVFGSSSELNRLGDDADGTGEAVHLTSLDIEAKRHGWGQIDFIKMDAEGEELKIIAGGTSVFETGSPVVMFEIKSETGNDLGIANAFKALGYGLYRLLPDGQHLVPFIEAELDAFELNLFAVKPAAAKALAARALLVETDMGPFEPGNFADWAASHAYSGAYPGLFARLATGDYAAGLDAYVAWRDEARPVSERYFALRTAHEALRRAAETAPTVARLTSLARVLVDIGQRIEAMEASKRSLMALDRDEPLEEPFIPPSARFEGLTGGPREWLGAAHIEALEHSSKHSSYYSGALPQLDWVSGTKFATHELERRRALTAVRHGRNVQLRKDLSKPAPDHRNAEVWARLMGA